MLCIIHIYREREKERDTEREIETDRKGDIEKREFPRLPQKRFLYRGAQFQYSHAACMGLYSN